MLDFKRGIKLGVNEDEYQAALQEYRGGLVASLKQDKSVLHKATCNTLSYDLASKGQESRSGKLLFRDHAELNAKVNDYPELTVDNRHLCSRCMKPAPE